MASRDLNLSPDQKLAQKLEADLAPPSLPKTDPHQATSQSISQSTGRSIDQLTNQPTSHLVDQSVNQMANPSTERSITQLTNRPSDRLVNPSIDPTTNQLMGEVRNKSLGFYLPEVINQKIDEAVSYYRKKYSAKIDRSAVVAALLGDADQWTEAALDRLYNKVFIQLTNRLTGRLSG